MTDTESSARSAVRTRTAGRAMLAVPRFWALWAVLLFALTVTLGLAAKVLPTLQLPHLDAAVNAVNAPALDVLALVLDVLDRPIVVAVILVAVFIALAPARGWRIALAACAASGLGWVTTLAVKAIVAQPRPTTAGLPHPLAVDPATLSYPSGHVVFVAALATALVLAMRRIRSRTIVGVVGVVVVVAVAWSRLYVGVHYVTDVVGGVINGVAGALLFAGLWNVLVAPRLAPRA